LAEPVDLGLTVGPIQRGSRDPCLRIGRRDLWRAQHTPDGPATLHVRVDSSGAGAVASAWGSGAAYAIEHAPRLIGCDDDPASFSTDHPLVSQLVRQCRGLRLMAADVVYDIAMAAVIEQRVTGFEARRSWIRLARRHGEPAPAAGRDGVPEDLRTPPAPDAVGALREVELRALDLEARRAGALMRVAGDARGLQRAAALGSEVLDRRLRSIGGIGPWTSEIVVQQVLGDADRVAVGDWHLPGLVGFALAGDAGADDERMLELLEPFRPHRGRVVRLLLAAGPAPQRTAARAEIPDLLAKERRGGPYRVRRTLRFDS
jgi:3-methyladenine DNA glycosylase/8-oxoguanine DNA glycosylase